MLVRVIGWSLGLVANVAVLVALQAAPLVEHALRPEQLPPIFIRHAIQRYPWPIAGDLAPLVIGKTEREVQAFFNDPYVLPPPGGPNRCLRFGQGWAHPPVTVLFEHGAATAIWLNRSVPDNSCSAFIDRSYPFETPLSEVPPNDKMQQTRHG